MRANKNLSEALSRQVGRVLNVHIILTRINDSKAGLEAVGWGEGAGEPCEVVEAAQAWG